MTPNGNVKITVRVPRRVPGGFGSRRDTIHCHYECRLQTRRLYSKLDKAIFDSMDMGPSRQPTQPLSNNELAPSKANHFAGHPWLEDSGAGEEKLLGKLLVLDAEALNMYQEPCIG